MKFYALCITLWIDPTNVRPALFYTKAFVLTLWLFVRSCSNCHIVLFKVRQFTVWSFKDRCAELFEMQADKKCLSIYPPYALVLVMLWSHNHVMSWLFPTYWNWNCVSRIFWHAGHHKTMAIFKSIAYAHNRCRSKNNVCSAISLLRILCRVMALTLMHCNHTYLINTSKAKCETTRQSWLLYKNIHFPGTFLRKM